MVLKGRQISHGAAYSDYSAMKEKAIYIGGEHLDDNTFVNRSTPDLEEIWLEFEREGSMYSKGGKDIKNTIIALEGSPTPEELKSLGINSTEETLSDEQKERLLELARQTLDTMDDMEISYNYKVKVKQKDANGKVIRDADGKPVTKDEIRQGKVPKTNLRNSKWFCMLHRDSKSGIWHFHFVISRFTKDGLDQNDPRLIAKRAARAAELVNQQRGWKSAERISTSHSAEIKDTVYDVLRKMDKFSWDDFKRDMEARTFTDYKGKQQNYELMFRNDSKGNVVGYSVWRGNSNYNASKIGKQLTASRLYKTWQAIHEDERKRATAKPKSQTVTPPKPKNIVYVKSEEEKKREMDELYRRLKAEKDKAEKEKAERRAEQQKPREQSQEEKEAHSAVSKSMQILNKFCGWSYNVFGRDEYSDLQEGIVGQCLLGGRDTTRENLQEAANELMGMVEGAAAQIEKATGLMVEFVAGMALPQVTPSGGGGGGQNTGGWRGKRDDDWWNLWKPVFAKFRSRGRGR